MGAHKHRKLVIPPGIAARFGRWTVIDGDAAAPDFGNYKPTQTFFRVRCECGAETTLPASKLRAGRSTQCGLCSRKQTGKGNRRVFHESVVGVRAIARLRAEGCVIELPPSEPQPQPCTGHCTHVKVEPTRATHEAGPYGVFPKPEAVDPGQA